MTMDLIRVVLREFKSGRLKTANLKDLDWFVTEAKWAREAASKLDYSKLSDKDKEIVDYLLKEIVYPINS